MPCQQIFNLFADLALGVIPYNMVAISNNYLCCKVCGEAADLLLMPYMELHNAKSTNRLPSKPHTCEFSTTLSTTNNVRCGVVIDDRAWRVLVSRATPLERLGACSIAIVDREIGSHRLSSLLPYVQRERERYGPEKQWRMTSPRKMAVQKLRWLERDGMDSRNSSSAPR